MNDDYKQLKKMYELINDELNDEIENLKYLIDHVEIENINLLTIHYKLKDLIFKKDQIKDKLYNEYNEFIIDEN